MSEPTRLKIQWDNLFPVDTFTIGDTDVPVKPMSFACLAGVLSELKGFNKILADNDINLGENVSPNDMLSIASLLVDKFPGALSRASNIHPEDIAEMPLDIVVGLLAKTIEVNMKSKDSMIKNFKGLTDLLPTVPEVA